MPESERAQACQACGQCEQRCPQAIAIGEGMKQIARFFA
jgi:predicted aldo/keto reductase-like oxidoreductase